MELEIKRTDFTDNSTIEKLSVNDQFECYTLERQVSQSKWRETSNTDWTLRGTSISLQRFGRQLPILLNVLEQNGKVVVELRGGEAALIYSPFRT